ncbi:MAG: type VI secretion system ATPase TssH, partial [Proteobacteria bacterium]|nr:type VI secretion system ATPase TssH [Pseudomonadota bacterium]
MRIDKLTSRLQSALADAQSLALGKEHNFIEPAHLLLSLIDQKGGSVKPLLAQVGFKLSDLRLQVQELVDQLPQVPDNGGEIAVSQDLTRLLNQADKLAQKKGDSFISSETVLLVAMNDKGVVGKLLNSSGVSLQALENAIANL